MQAAFVHARVRDDGDGTALAGQGGDLTIVARIILGDPSTLGVHQARRVLHRVGKSEPGIS